ncbi:sugar phosphate isomerase/epimerase family protein [Atribacter laminatus]|uniref:D-psicose 3-epimerase n=1 Tax=Atribacter laminatus TaxID=2847778 RepID=A0A7T1AKY2_ATRLM|nr:sugar phosphate isomerase/epimerase family protein [Atribacter laminatus]QPM67841.1 D-psicose 3-epimerase [Atribacter laminatus]
MKFSVCSGNYGREPLEKIINRAAELEFDGVELTVAFHTHPSISFKERQKINGYFANAGIKCSSLHFIFDKTVKLSSQNFEDIKQNILYFKAVIDLASDFNTSTIVVGGGGSRSIKADQTRSEVEDNFEKMLSEVADYASEKKVTLCLEALNRYETNFLKTLKECSDISSRIKSPYVKIMGDTYHMNIEEVSIEKAIIESKNDLVHLHFADSNRMSPGEGHINFLEVLKALKTIKFDGYCAFEIFALTPEKLCFDSFEEADKHMVLGKKYIDNLVTSI